MRKPLVTITSVALALGLASCTDLVGYGSYDVSGSFELRTFNGSPPPTIIYQDAFEQDQLMAETFTIYSDGTYTDDYTIRVFTQGGSTQSAHRDVGTYQQNNTALQFRDSATGDVFTGSVTGNTLTVTQLGDVYVFQR
jgi:hypothetical protein